MLVSSFGSMPRIQGAPTCDWPLSGCGFDQHLRQDVGRDGFDILGSDEIWRMIAW